MISWTDFTWTDAMTQNKDRSKTAPLTADPEQVRQNLPPRAALLIYHRDGNTVVTLMPDESVVVGRSRPADVVIPDPTVSSKHARFKYAGGATVTLTDLGSTNGTFVNDAPVAEGAGGAIDVEPGDHIRCGSAVVVLHFLTHGERRPRGLDNHERVAAALAEELERARHFARNVSILLVSARAEGVHVGTFASDVNAHIRAVDRAALLTPTVLEVLLSERNAGEAKAVADAIAESCKGVAVGVASYPELCPGRPDALMEAARTALARARKNGGVALAERSLTKVLDEKAPPVIASPSMKKLFDNVGKFARSTMPVLIHGETGSGKEVVARSLHEGGPRKGAPMLSVNCGALPQHLVESTLFGHVKGAFTGADRDQPGLFESANGGTVFLDEIGELPPQAQAALLRVLEAKVVTRVGAPHKEIKVDVRIVAATHKDLEEMAAEGTFRQDLRYRLEGERFDVPPLRLRPEEILPIAQRFLERSTDNSHIEGLDDDAKSALLSYDWPGNVRELKNAIERAVVVSAGPLITVDDLPATVRQRAATARSPVQRTGLHRLDDVALRREAQPLPAAPPPAPPAAQAAPAPELTSGEGAAEASGEGDASEGDGGEGGDFRSRMRALEAKVLIDALERNAGVQTAAAKDLQMPVRTLVFKLKALGIKRDKGKYIHAPSADDDVSSEEV